MCADKETYLIFRFNGFYTIKPFCLSVVSTEPSYRNESSDSVSRKPLDEFQNAFNTKQIFIFDGGFVTTILSNSTIYSTLLIDLSILVHCPFLFIFPIEMRVAAEQQEKKRGRMGEKSFPSSSRVA